MRRPGGRTRGAGPRGTAGCALGAAVLVLAAAAPVAAHPTPVSDDVQTGRSTTITVFLYPDEGPVTGFDVTLPSSFRLAAATGDSRLPTVTTTGDVVRFRTAAGAPLGTPDFATVRIVGTPGSTPVSLGFVAQRVRQSPFDYGLVVVGGPVTAAASSSTSGRLALTAGLLGLGGIAAAAAELTRRRRRRRGTLAA